VGQLSVLFDGAAAASAGIPRWDIQRAAVLGMLTLAQVSGVFRRRGLFALRVVVWAASSAC
jgi:hypothetical protein